MRLAAPLLILAYGLVSVVSLRNLHADGSYALLRSLLDEGYWIGDPYRIAADLVAQTSVAVPIHAGVNSISILAYAQGVGLLLVPAAAWAAALLISRRSPVFEFLLLGYCATALTSGFLAVGTYNYLFAFTGLCFAAIVRGFTGGGRVVPWVAAASSVLVGWSHGLAALLAPVLIAAIVLLRRRCGWPAGHRAAWLVTIVVLALGTILAALSVAIPYSPGNVVMAADLATPAFENRQLQFLVVWLLLLPVAVAARPLWLAWSVRGVLAVSLIVLVLSPGLWATPMQQHASRSVSAILLLLIMVAALLVVLPGVGDSGDAPARSQGGVNGAFTGLTFALLAALLVPASVQAVQFGSFVRDLQAFVQARTGIVDNDDLVEIVPGAARYGWPWTYPTMSIVLGQASGGAIVRNPEDTIWNPPFLPENAPSIPGRFSN